MRLKLKVYSTTCTTTCNNGLLTGPYQCDFWGLIHNASKANTLEANNEH